MKHSSLLRACRPHLLVLAGGVVFWLLFLLLRPQRAVMNWIIDHLTTSWKQGISWLFCLMPWSGMELCIAAGVVVAVWLIVRCVRRFRKEGKEILCRTLLVFCCAGVLIYDGFCLLWGINYYGDSFSDKSGLTAEPVSAEQLYLTTRYYADLAGSLAGEVERDEDGAFAVSRKEIFAEAETVYEGISSRWPFLETPWRQPKGMIFSKIMSLTNFTGVYFPFTGESNLNVDSPACLLPSTIAHELAHQKNIAPEQEANFVAVLACRESGQPVYAYSGALLAYIYLGNALYQADRELWKEVYQSLDPLVRQDLDENNAYWARWETRTAQAAEAIYTGFLQSYGQELGMKSYGACVDLLVAEYLEGIE